MNDIDSHLADIRSSIEPNSFRYRVLQSAATFKAGWTDLAQKLSEVLNQNLHAEWGYSSFEQYCRLEIRITKKTALKLTGAWDFVKEEAKTYLEKHPEPENIPDLQAVEMLRKAKKIESQSPEAYSDFKERVFSEGSDAKEISRQFKEFNKLLGNAQTKTDHDIALDLIGKARQRLLTVSAPQIYLTYLSEIEHYLKVETGTI